MTQVGAYLLMLMHNKTQRKMLTSPFSLFEKKKHFATSKNTLKKQALSDYSSNKMRW